MSYLLIVLEKLAKFLGELFFWRARYIEKHVHRQVAVGQRAVTKKRNSFRLASGQKK